MSRLPSLLGAASIALLGALAPAGPGGAACAAAGNARAALVVEHADGSVVSRCVGFGGSQTTAAALLAASGVEYQTATFGGFGQAVCQLDEEPSSYPPSCWSSSGPYWAFFVSRGGGAWQFSTVGISALTLHDGDALGFRYEPQSGAPAGPVSPRGVCPPIAAATPVARTAPPAARTASPSTAPPTPAPALTNGPQTLQPRADATEASSSAGPPGPTAATAAPSQAVAAISVAPALSPTASAPAALAASREAPPGGPDSGLVAAFAAGGALLGLAALRLLGRRTRRQ